MISAQGSNEKTVTLQQKVPKTKNELHIYLLVWADNKLKYPIINMTYGCFC